MVNIEVIERLPNDRYRVRRLCCGRIDVLSARALKADRVCPRCKKVRHAGWSRNNESLSRSAPWPASGDNFDTVGVVVFF